MEMLEEVEASLRLPFDDARLINCADEATKRQTVYGLEIFCF